MLTLKISINRIYFTQAKKCPATISSGTSFLQNETLKNFYCLAWSSFTSLPSLSILIQSPFLFITLARPFTKERA